MAGATAPSAPPELGLPRETASPSSGCVSLVRVAWVQATVCGPIRPPTGRKHIRGRRLGTCYAPSSPHAPSRSQSPSCSPWPVRKPHRPRRYGAAGDHITYLRYLGANGWYLPRAKDPQRVAFAASVPPEAKLDLSREPIQVDAGPVSLLRVPGYGKRAAARATAASSAEAHSSSRPERASRPERMRNAASPRTSAMSRSPPASMSLESGEFAAVVVLAGAAIRF